MARRTSSGERIVPTPTMACGTSRTIRRMASEAAAVLNVTSSVGTPPASSARAKGTARSASSMLSTGINRPCARIASRRSRTDIALEPFRQTGRRQFRAWPGLTWNNGAAILDDDACEHVSGPGGCCRRTTLQAGAQICRREAVARRRGVDHRRYRFGGDFEHGIAIADATGRMFQLQHDLGVPPVRLQEALPIWPA